jgi:hypothetical protein
LPKFRVIGLNSGILESGFLSTGATVNVFAAGAWKPVNCFEGDPFLNPSKPNLGLSSSGFFISTFLNPYI